jgi:hypothetical protein
MTRFEPLSPAHSAAIMRFNARLSGLKSSLTFPTELDGPHDATESGISYGRFLVLDKEGEMRAGYRIKHQMFKVGGSLQDVIAIQAPISEGWRDRTYASYGGLIIVDALRRNPLAYALGMGGESRSYPRLLAAMKWKVLPVPFFLKVLRPFRFCRRIRFLRARPAVRVSLDILAFSGLGFLGIRIANLRSRAPRLGPELVIENIENFTPWADELWASASSAYCLAALRSAKTLDKLYENRRFLRFRIIRSGTTLGWAVCLVTTFEDHLQFGAMRLGSLVDCFAEPGAESLVIAAAEQKLAQENVDLIITNQSHTAWRAALKQAAYLQARSNFLVAYSPALWHAMEEAGMSIEGVHMTRGDGDGPGRL